jgi:AcrR family transcriptional regulator
MARATRTPAPPPTRAATRAARAAPTARASPPARAAPALSDETRARLLRAAGEVFAASGFRRATVRDICKRAGANIAAVNYHFDGKQGLYAEVVKSGVGLGLQKFPIDLGVPPNATPEQRLLGFVRSFLHRTLGHGPHAHAGRIMVREMAEPTSALDALFKDHVRHLYAHLESIVQDLLGPAATPQRVRLGCASVLGQCTIYRLGSALLSRVQPGPATDLPPAQIDAMAAHITFLTAAGLRAFPAHEEAVPADDSSGSGNC